MRNWKVVFLSFCMFHFRNLKLISTKLDMGGPYKDISCWTNVILVPAGV
jgi:hypothetical protein